MANSLSGGGPTFGGLRPPIDPSRAGLRVGAAGTGRGITQGNAVPPPNPIVRFFRGGDLEGVVRPFSDSKAFALLDRLKAKRRAPGDLGEASIAWGGPSNFTLRENDAPTQPNHIGVTVNNPGEQPEDELPPEEPAAEIVYEEVSRTTEVVRVTNPSDPAQFVDIERIKTITWRAPDGVKHTFPLNWGA